MSLSPLAALCPSIRQCQEIARSTGLRQSQPFAIASSPTPVENAKERAFHLIATLDLEGEAAKQAMNVKKVRLAYRLLEEKSGLSIIEMMKRGHNSLLERLKNSPLLPKEEREAIASERGDLPYLTGEEWELVENLLKAPWILRHTTDSLEEILENRKLLSIEERKRRSCDARSNSHTPTDGTNDNVFFSCGIGQGHSPDFLKEASAIIEMEWREAEKRAPKQFAGIWGGEHYFRYLRDYTSPPLLLSGTLFTLRYRREVLRESGERCSIKEYTFSREDGTRLLFSLEKGEETSTGEAIRPAMALRFIELMRLAGPRFRRHVLDERENIEALSYLFSQFFGPGEFEVRIPGKFSMKGDIDVKFYDKEAHSKKSKRTVTDIDAQLCRALGSNSYENVTKLIRRGADPNCSIKRPTFTRTLLDCAVEYSCPSMIKLLLDLGASVDSESYYPMKGDQIPKRHTPIYTAISRSYLEAIELFVEQGTIDSRDSAIRHPVKVTLDMLFLALDAENKKGEVAEYFLKHLEGYPNLNSYSLIYCCMKRNSRYIDYFIEKGADLNFRHTDESLILSLWSTPLIEAVKSGYLPTVEKLAGCGADLNLPLISNGRYPVKYEGYSPLMIAIACWEKDGDFALIDWLMQCEKVSLKHRDIHGHNLADILLPSKLPLKKKNKLLRQLQKEGVQASSPLRDKIEERNDRAFAAVIAENSDGELSILLSETIGKDWVRRIGLPNERQDYVKESSLLDTAIRMVHDQTGVVLKKEKASLLLSREEKNCERENFYLFRLKETISPVDLRSTRITAKTLWVKVADLRKKFSGELPLSPIAVAIAEALSKGEKIEEHPQIEQALFCEEEGVADLRRAVKSGDVEKAEELFDMGIDPNAEGAMLSDGSILQAAFKSRNPAMARLLIARGSSLLTSVRRPWFFGGDIPLLTYAIELESLPLVELLEELEDQTFNDPLTLYSAVIKAAEAKDPAFLNYFLKRYRGKRSLAPALAEAARLGRAANVKLLLAEVEFSGGELKEAILAKKPSNLKEEYLGSPQEYEELFTLLLGAGEFDDSTLAKLLHKAISNRFSMDCIKKILELNLLAYAPKKERFQKNFPIYSDDIDLLPLSRFLHQRGARYDSLFIYQRRSNLKNSFLQLAWESGDLKREAAFCYNFFSLLNNDSQLIGRLKEMGIATSAKDCLGFTLLHRLVEDAENNPNLIPAVIQLLQEGANPFTSALNPAEERFTPLIESIADGKNERLKQEVIAWVESSKWKEIYQLYLLRLKKSSSEYKEKLEEVTKSCALISRLLESTLPFDCDLYAPHIGKELLTPASEEAFALYREEIREVEGVRVMWLLWNTYPSLRALFSSRHSYEPPLGEKIIRSLRQKSAQRELQERERPSHWRVNERLLDFILLLSHLNGTLEKIDWPLEEREKAAKQLLIDGGFSERECSFAWIAITLKNLLKNLTGELITVEMALKQLHIMERELSCSLEECYDIVMLIELSLGYGNHNSDFTLTRHIEVGYLRSPWDDAEKYDHLYCAIADKNLEALERLARSDKQEICGRCGSTYHIYGNPSPVNGAMIPIKIEIGRLPENRELTFEALPLIFSTANKFTIDVPYPLQDNSLTICGREVHRPNHNGTHSARQARYLMELIVLVNHCGTPRNKGLLSSLGDRGQWNLLLAAYLQRSGRVDERNHNSLEPDDYYKRSALIYREYANQLNLAAEEIAFAELLLLNSCKPEGLRDQLIEREPLFMLGYELLTLAHELDLVRCQRGDNFLNSTLLAIERRLLFLIGDSSTAKLSATDLLHLAKEACHATGSPTMYHRCKGNRELFSLCSSDAALCWDLLLKIPCNKKS